MPLADGQVGHVRRGRRAGGRSSAARASTRSVVAVSATPAPSPASSRAQAWPMPDSLPQPVTRATRPVKSNGFPLTGRDSTSPART